MKRLFAVCMTILILSGVYVGTLAITGNEPLAQVVTYSMTGFSAIMHISNYFNKGLAFEAIVIPDFTEKTQEEISEMNSTELEAYLKERNVYQKAVLRKEVQDEIVEQLKKHEDSEALKTLQENFDKLVKEHDNLMLEMKKMVEKKKEGDDDQKTDLEKFIERNRTEDLESRTQKMDKIEVKVAALMTTANVLPNVANGFNQLFGNYIDTTIHDTPKPENFILPLVSIVTAPGTENIYYVDRINEEGTAQFIGEGDLKPLADGEWQESKADVKEVAVRWKMSNRLINHAPSVVNDFRTHADELMDQVIDDGVATGDGLGNNLTGVSTAASPFVAPAQLANFYQDPNIWDVIMAVATYVRLNNFKGNLTCVLNTVWMAKMKAYKNLDGDYIIPPFVTQDGKTVGEVKVVFTNKLPDTDILLGDLKKFKVVIAENIAYFEGWENDDFSKNLSSRKLEAFLGTYFPTSDSGSIIYDTIATIQTAIAAP